jgi:electron-transferring-flavoprotein dehydrogenase
LAWKYKDYNPQEELERFKKHPFIKRLIEEGEVVSAGAKMIPEGGYFSLPKLGCEGALLLGDAAGFVNISRFKGIHLAIATGMAAADAVTKQFQKSSSTPIVPLYRKKLKNYKVMREMFFGRNFRQVFAQPFGAWLGAPLSIIQGLIPFKLYFPSDRKSTQEISINRNGQFRFKREDLVYLARVKHKEDELSHINIKEPDLCLQCKEQYDGSCCFFCPGKVYTWDDEKNDLIVSPSNCLHDRSCVVKCPFDNIDWRDPENGEGPFYSNM